MTKGRNAQAHPDLGLKLLVVQALHGNEADCMEDSSSMAGLDLVDCAPGELAQAQDMSMDASTQTDIAMGGAGKEELLATEAAEAAVAAKFFPKYVDMAVQTVVEVGQELLLAKEVAEDAAAAKMAEEERSITAAFPKTEEIEEVGDMDDPFVMMSGMGEQAVAETRLELCKAPTAKMVELEYLTKELDLPPEFVDAEGVGAILASLASSFAEWQVVEKKRNGC